MADTSATIIAASLNSDDLETSINKLVSMVAKETKAMADNFTGEIKRMEDAVKNLGNIKISSGGASDGGSSRRTSTLKKEEEQVRSVVSGYDAIAAANSRAAQSASAFIQNEREQLRMRQHEIEARLKDIQSKYGNVEIRTIVRDDGTFSRAIDNIKQKIQEARQRLQEVPPTSALGKQFSQELQNARIEYNELLKSRKAFESQSQVANLTAEYQQNNQKIQELASAYAKASVGEKQLEENMKKGAMVIQDYSKSIEQAEKASLQKSLAHAMKIPTNEIDLARTKLESLQGLLIQMSERGLLSNSQKFKINEEIQRLVNYIADAESKQNSLFNGAQRYTEELRKQAQAIRESQEWKQNGSYLVWTNKETNSFSIVDARDRRSIEEQLLAIYEAESRDKTKLTSQEKEQNEAAKERLETEKKIIETTTKQPPQPKTFASYDSLRESIAHVLGMQQSQIKLADTETASYNNLSTTLKQLKQAYDRLTSSERNSDQGKVLVASMNEVERAIQRIKAQAARPVSLESIIGINGKGGLSEKTLDDIAYKMQRLASYRSGLDVNTRRAEIREVNTEYDRLKKKMDEVMQKNQQMIGSNNALGRSWNYMKNRLAFYFTVGASTQFIKNLIEVRSQYEMNERALGILINSAERGTQIFNELSQMALVSPYTLIELSSAAKQLTAYDIAAKDVVDTTRRLADMASAVGVPMERLTYALGQIKAYGYLNSRDARMFANAGIPLVRELSKYYTELEGKMVSVGDVYDRMKKKAIDFNSVMSVVTKMTDEGGKFFDFQAKMADTLKVRLANLTLAWNNMLNEMGAETQGVLTTAIGSLRTLFAHWKDIDRLLKTIAWTFGMAKLVQVIQIANIGLAAFGKQMAWNILVGRKLSAVIFTVARSLKTLALSPITWITLLATAATSATMAIWNMNEAQESLNKSLRESAKDNYKNINQFLENYKSIRDSLYKEEKDENTGKTIKTPIDIDKGEAKKAWEAIREQIELSSHASDEYVGKLLEVENISERVRQGFDVLEEIKVVSAALKELGDDAIKMDTDWSDWWNANLLPDGWVENLKDYEKELEKVREKYEDVSAARERWQKDKFANAELNEDFVSLDSSLVKFRDNIATTAKSVFEFLKNKEWDADINKINEVFKQVGDRMIQEGQLNPKDAFVFQTQWEAARSEASKRALEIRIADEKEALAVARTENRKADVQARIDTLQDELDNFNLYNGKSKAYWDNFTKWLKEQHRSEVTEMFRGMDAEQIKSLNFQEGEYGSWVTRMVEKYKKENKLSNDEVFQYLHHWVVNANKWSIFIPLTISTESDKTIYQQLTEADSAIDAAYQKIERLKTRRDELSKKGGALSSDKKVAEEYAKVSDEISDAQEDYNKALEKGGHSKKENAAATKAQKQAESELAKALKDELKLIETVRSSYKDLIKDGASHADAVKKSVSGYEKSVANINKVLEKYGVKLDLTKFAGIANPHELQEMFKEQLNALAGKAKPTEIQALEVELQKVGLDVEKYDLTKITKGLKNELDRLKEEYELAIALDADPELGDVFADFMGIDKQKLAELPRSYNQLLSMFQSKIDTLFDENDVALDFDLSKMINKENFDKWIKDNGHTLEDGMAKSLNAIREYLYKILNDETKQLSELVKKYGDAHARIEKIYATTSRNVLSVISTYGNNEDREKAIDLSSKIAIEDSPEVVARLRNELNSLGKKVAEGNDAAQTMLDAIFKNQGEDIGKTLWDNFKGNDYYSVIFDDLSRASTSALQTMKAQLDVIKDKIKESPEAMKAFMSAYRKLREELIARDPFRGIVNSLNDMRAAHQDVIISQAELDKAVANAKEKETALKNLREKEPNNIKAIYKAEKELSNAKKDVNSKTVKLIQSQNRETSTRNDYKKAIKEVGVAIKKLGDALSEIGNTMNNTTGDVLKFIGNIFNFVTVVSEGMQSVSSTAAKSIQAIERASVILTIISAAIKLIQEINSLIPDAFDQYQDAAERRAEINKLTDAVVEYRLAVLAARLEEENWFSENSLKQLKNYYDIGSTALDNYNKKLIERQAIYQNEQGGGWLTKFAYWTNPATWIKKITGIEGDWADAIALLGSGMFGMEAQMGQLGIWLTQHANDTIYEYEEGFTAALNNLRIEVRSASSGFLGTGLGAHSQETEDLIEWMKRELGFDLFDEDFMINESAYKVLMDKYADKLVGETKATLESLHELTEKWNEYIEKLQEYVNDLYSPLVTNMTDAMWSWFDEGKDALDSFKEYASETFREIVTDMMRKIILSNFADEYANDVSELYEKYVKGKLSDTELIAQVGRRTGTMVEAFKENIPVLQEIITTAAGAFGQIGVALSNQEGLSSLQQGIQGITEDTAGALEAYMNGVSQQMYYQSDLMTQIRDAVVELNLDVQVATMSQILLQLRSSYEVQTAIHSVIEGWSSPNGMSVRVEMI